jgi:hypothetical protein
MKVILKCPVCRGKFKYEVSEGWPDFCQLPDCKADINNRRDDDDVVIPYFLSEKTRKTDAVARQIMDGSVQRAEMAAAVAGVPVSEMNGLKITDLNDRNDTPQSIKPVSNDITRHMAAMNARGMPVGFQRQQAQEAAATTHTGVEPCAGARMRNKLWNTHHEGSTGVAPEMVPLEIRNNPNYVRRG